MFGVRINAQAARKQTAAPLGRLLADSYMLYIKTQAFHWNVTGPQFEPLHTLFLEQCAELASGIDEIAQRIRTLGVKTPGSFCELVSLTSIEQETGVPGAAAMVRQLQSDHMKEKMSGRKQRKRSISCLEN